MPFRLYLSLVIVILALIGLYINRVYAHVFEDLLVPIPIDRKYTVGEQTSQKTLKYVVLGDSLSYGVGAESYQQTYPYLVAEKIASQNQAKVDVVNLAIPGATIDKVVEQELDQAVAEKPDYISIMIGTNDIRAYIPKSTYQKQYQQILDRLKQQTSAKIVIINNPLLGTNETYRFPLKSFFDSRVKDYNLLLSLIAQLNQVELIELYDITNSFDNTYYSEDDFHLNPKGYAVWGKVISDHI
jgi:acyl-CoA thioesterase I